MNPTPRPALPLGFARAALIAAGLALAWALPAARGQFGGGGDRGEFSPSRSEMMAIPPILIFFPPNPPPLGRAIARTPAATGRGAAPTELAAFVNEPFYAPLSTRLADKPLPPKLRAQLDQYRATKLALQAEIRAELDRVRNLEPESRRQALAAFAQRQGARVAELEASAEQLRRDLIVGDQAWGALRQWHLGDSDRRGFSPLEISQVMRGYAFYHPGLLPAQRRLLREISIELTMAGDNMITATAQQPYLFFLPEPARVLLPDDIPGEVAAKMAAFQTKKSVLKKELYDAVYAYDGQRLNFLRGNSLKTLSEKQAPAVAELEAIAEDIRRGLAGVSEPTAIGERSPLPPTLQHRVATLMEDYITLQKDTALRVDAILAEGKDLPMQSSYRFENDGLKFVVAPTRGASGRGSRGGPPGTPASPDAFARIADIRTRVSAIADEFGQQVAKFINEKDAIRAEIQRTLGNAKAHAVDLALLSAMRVATAKQTEGQYSEYRITVFQPGLSPGQRRILFDSVMERLELPLPRGEFQPTLRGNSW